jgi:hypothetical protein
MNAANLKELQDSTKLLPNGVHFFTYYKTILLPNEAYHFG